MVNKRFMVLSLLVVTLLGFLTGCAPKTSESVSETATTVNIETARERDIYGSSSYSGRIKASSEAEVLPKTNARVLTIRVKEGQEIKAGEVLMTLDSSSFRSSLRQAEAKVASSRASQVNNQAQLETARKAYERTKQLFDAGAVSQSDLESAENAYNSLQSGIVEAAAAEAEAALMAAQEAVDNCSITAPVSGTVGRIDVSVGEFVTANTTVAVISDSRQLNVDIWVGESDITKIKLNSRVNVYVKSISDQPVSGTVSAIASVLGPNSDLYPVTITIDNTGGNIKSGMYAEVTVDTSSVKHALCVPLSAVLPSDGVNIVYAVDKKNRARRVEVKTGISDQKYTQVLSGLKAGDKVVTLGNTLISDGSLLKTKDKEGK